MVAHIVPGLIPGECGIGDYAVTVAQGMAAHGVPGRFVVAGRELAHRADEYDARGNFPVVLVKGNDENGLIAALDDPAIGVAVLHYTGYGYKVNGAPNWLVRALTVVRRRRRDLRLITFFHEIWEFPALLKRSLYRSPLQKRVGLGLCRLSDAILANTTTRAQMLAKYHAGGCAAVPVFSNVGENPDGTATDPKLAVTFGLGRRRQMVWSRLAEQPELLTRLGVTTVADIGTRSFALPEALGTIAAPQGRLDAPEVSALLSRAPRDAVAASLADWRRPHGVARASAFSRNSSGRAFFRPRDRDRTRLRFQGLLSNRSWHRRVA